MRKINFYVFGEAGKYDEYNPYNILSKDNVSDIIYLIAENDVFTVNKDSIRDKLNIGLKEISTIIDSLILINAIEVKADTYKLNFPVFLEEDIDELDLRFNEVGIKICNNIIEIKNSIFDKLNRYKEIEYKRMLYHIICDSIFDGIAMEYFSDKDIFSISKEQPGDRNYIIVGYESTPKLEEYSNRLLCSSNNYRTDKFIFNSFGDCNGNRKDIYRFFRMVNQNNHNISGFEDLNKSYNKLNEYMNKSIMNTCGNLIIKISKGLDNYNIYEEYEKQLIDFLKDINYISIDNEYKISIEIPIFDKSHINIVEEIAEVILPNIESIVKDFFYDIEIRSKEITPIKHNIDIKEVANELWHLVFGFINENLVKTEFVALPYENSIEGRYLQSLYIK